MKNARQIPLFTRTIIWGLLVASLVTVWAPQPGIAMLAPATSATGGSETDRLADVQTVQRALENKLIRQRLEDLGFTQEEVNAKLNGLSDAQLHQMASQIDALLPGGSVDLTTIIALLVILAIVLVIAILI